MNGDARKLISAIPLIMFLVFAGFWSAVDVAKGVYWAIIPSGLVALALVVKAVLSRRRRSP